MVAASRRAGFQPTTTRAGDGITGPCPCCGGTDRVWIGSLPDGGPPWMAWSHGCSFEDMRSTLGRDASGHASGGGPGHNPVDSSTDEAGTPVFEVERRRAAGGRGQQFRPRHTAADDAVVWTLPPAGRGLVSPLPAVKRAIKNQDLVGGGGGRERRGPPDVAPPLHPLQRGRGERRRPALDMDAAPRGALVRRGAGGGDSRRGRGRPGARGVGGAVGGRHGHARAGGGHRGVWPRPRTRRRRFHLAGYARA